jgi:hypothetical protein
MIALAGAWILIAAIALFVLYSLRWILIPAFLFRLAMSAVAA